MGHVPAKNNDPRMKGERARNRGSGRLRQKRGDTRTRTLENEYGVKLRVPPNTRLDTMRGRTGKSNVADVIEELKA